MALRVDGLLQETRAAAITVTIECAQDGLRLRKLHQALAGLGKMVVIGIVGALAQVRREAQGAGQQGQRQQRNETQRPVQDEQRGQQYHGRDGAANHGREHVGGQLGHVHHALRDDVTELGRVLGREPADGQARHMVAQALARPLQDRHTHAHARPFHLATPAPAGKQPGQQHQQPQGRAPHVGGQQPPQGQHQRRDRQPAEYAIRDGHGAVAAEHGRIIAQQLNECLQHGNSASSGDAWQPPSAHSCA